METAVVREQFRRNGVGLLTGDAAFVDEHTVKIGDPVGELPDISVTAENIVIAAGTRPARPDGVDFDERRVIDSDGVLHLELPVPKTMTVVGAGEGDRLVRGELCSEAIRLGRLLARLMPREAEVHGLLGLMLLHDARREARAGGPAAGLAVLEPLLDDPALAGYQPLHAARADLLRRSGDPDGAAAAYERAISLSDNAVQRAELERRRDTPAIGQSANPAVSARR
jgi:hypothetical protein